MTALESPAWLREVDAALVVNPQVLLTGNLRDIVLIPRDADKAPRQLSVVDALVGQLTQAGHVDILVADPVDGIRVIKDGSGNVSRIAESAAGPDTDEASFLRMLRTLLNSVVTSASPCCLIVSTASRIVQDGNFRDEELHALFSAAEKRMTDAVRVRVEGPHRSPLYNTVFWMLDRESDFPHWLVSTELARVVSIPPPMISHRIAMARSAFGWRQTDAATGDPETTAAAMRLAELADGLTLRSIDEINRLRIDSEAAPAQIDEVVRTFRVGVPDNPWQSGDLKDRVRGGVQLLNDKVLGQPAAVRKSVDILIRSVLGLTGAQNRVSGAKPQGVLFFAGPTGVGKTELAKSLAELVFGGRESFLRFDMSEFSSEHAEARLIGAPPGYTGFGRGGELTNAVREQPFRLILFDEIEKAHPRILDKFLQILEDGRLSDGNGATVFFSETLLVFTSNLGVYGTDERGRRVLLVQPGEYGDVEAKVRAAVADHFTKEIGRPEILNRIGDNVVVFDFISPETARLLVPKFVSNVMGRVRDKMGVEVSVSLPVLEQLEAHALAKLEFGGRGVSNVVESMLVNPLARALFEKPDTVGSATVTGLNQTAEGWVVTLK